MYRKSLFLGIWGTCQTEIAQNLKKANPNYPEVANKSWRNY